MFVRAKAGATQEVAVGEQERVRSLVGDDVDRIDGQHIRAVREIGDAAEAFGFALRAVDAVRAVRGPSAGYWPPD